MRIILIRRKLIPCLSFVVCFAAPLAGQATDSLSAARRVVAAVSLAAKEYRIGVPGAPGRVTVAEEVDEARQFIEQARFDVPFLPRAARAATDSGLKQLLALIKAAAAADSVDRVAQDVGERIARSAGGAIVPLPARPPSPARGAQVYREQCANCHGDQGRGDGPKAHTVEGPPPADLTDPAAMSQLSLVDIYRKVTIGVAGTAMPQFEEALPDSDRWAVSAYTATLQFGGSATAGVFTTVRHQLDSAVAARSDRLVFSAYLTFEQVETDLRARNPGLTTRLEGEFARLQARAATGADGAELEALHRALLADLERAERIVSDRGSGANLLVQSLMLMVREGFEAILIVGALMTFLGKAGAADRRHEVARGAWLAVAASVVTAVAIELLFHVTAGQREVLEGITMLVAVAVLFYVSYWVLSKIEADRWNAFLKSKMHDALTSESGLALASVAFLAVYREGFETILFYKALLSSAGSGEVGAVLAGIALGAAVLVILYVAINRYGMRLPMKPFFAVTGALLYYMAFVFAGQGVKDLQEAGLVGLTVLEGWPRWPQLGIYPTVQSLALQGVLVVLLVFGLAWSRLRRPPAPLHG
ncbi:MAG: hypothetical protein DMD29_04740 [Gemmatimonadetes bacterium]|nr:MAG: hypothetical protein DMD29_04740 [Gemmatimonadota bacterium]